MARNLRKSAVYTRNFPQQITLVEFNSFRSELYYRDTFPIQSMVGEKRTIFESSKLFLLLKLLLLLLTK